MKLSLILLLAVTAAAVAQTPAAIYKSNSELMEILNKNIPAARDQADSPVDKESNYRINVVHRSKPGVAMAHATGPAKGTEVHYIIDGSATVITGGTLLHPAGAPADIQGGVEHHLAKGDVLVIPAGTPHWYKSVEGSVTYLEVRFDVSNK